MVPSLTYMSHTTHVNEMALILPFIKTVEPAQRITVVTWVLHGLQSKSHLCYYIESNYLRRINEESGSQTQIMGSIAGKGKSFTFALLTQYQCSLESYHVLVFSLAETRPSRLLPPRIILLRDSISRAPLKSYWRRR